MDDILTGSAVRHDVSLERLPLFRTRSAGGPGQVQPGVHVEAEPPVDVRPEQRRQPPPVLLGELAGPPGISQDRLEELGVDEHQGRLQEVERQHGDLSVLAGRLW